MEWVETTGRSIEEAKDAALDQLGVAEDDAEFEILEEPRFGLFGRLRTEARLRARVRPTKPRPKEERRDRRGRKRPGAGDGTGTTTTGTTTTGTTTTGTTTNGTQGVVGAPGASGGDNGATVGVTARVQEAEDGRAEASEPGSDGSSSAAAQGAAARSRRGGRQRGGTSGRSGIRTGDDREAGSRDTGPASMAGHDSRQSDSQELEGSSRGGGMDVSLDEQGAVAEQFLAGLVERLRLDADIVVERPEEEIVELNLQGDDLGMLIGAKGATLIAIQDLTRTVVQRRTSASNGRMYVDVAGYRRKRKEALERFSRQLAEEVRTSGTQRLLEPMSAADRKIVHDTVNDVEGVATTSEGEEPRRRVVIFPAAT